MSTLEKTINLLNALPENQIEMIYSFLVHSRWRNKLFVNRVKTKARYRNS